MSWKSPESEDMTGCFRIYLFLMVKIRLCSTIGHGETRRNFSNKKTVVHAAALFTDFRKQKPGETSEITLLIM